MTESFNDSFNQEFCEYLEYHLCRAFDHSELEELRGFWCDGVSWAPYYNENVNRDYLRAENILKTKKIVTTANTGASGQDYYELTLQLGTSALKRYELGLSLIDCLPEEDSIGWFDLDVVNKKMEIRLK